ncbi:uncharacterized protein BX664DRAFT_260416 [Halteromyces radiatus]|uniref:uncharacterized protein n=1 Tax=Halteromyces radiatus TaxID=101107 RepID=UPI00221E5259|nr:uncharacterized protein BX664DRAFT_260416 [Halteromyces radiatus]KAI8093115.1 hypothetical protein BX664DRAFT_260416 [Halteromyces radiatus]
MPISGRPPSNTVILSNLDPAATVNDVQVACGTFGPVVRCELVRDHLGRSCGEAEIEFLDHRSALDCIARYDNEKVDHRIIRATLRHPPAYPTVRSTIAPTRSGYRTT